jgi:AcrR family transcriptional regulator
MMAMPDAATATPVTTPWGPADALRERMLPPGPGTPAEEVDRNQRERLYGAIVAVAASRGYAATRVADLVEASGVSRRSFYALFPDKQACLTGALAAMNDAVEAHLASPLPEGREERAHRLAAGLAAALASQPAAARLYLIDAPGAGPEVARALQAAVTGFKNRLRALGLFEVDGEPMPGEMEDLIVGAVEAVARRCLLSDRTEEAPPLLGELLGLLLPLPPPSAPLEPVPRPSAAAAETVQAPDHAERILRAFVVLVAESGYGEVTISQIVKRAAISPATFYANFSGKEDVLMAALDSARAQTVAAILPAFRRTPDWPQGVRAAFGALFGFLASRPALSRLLLVEVYGAGPRAVAHRGVALGALDVLFAEGKREAPALPSAAVEALAGGITALVTRRFLAEGSQALPALAPLCTYLALTPFVGPDAAASVASGDDRTAEPGRWRDSVREVAVRPLRQRILNCLSREIDTLAGIVEELEAPRDEVEGEIRGLEEGGLVEAVEEPGAEEPGAQRYRSQMTRITAPEWDPMSLTERQRLSARVGELIEGDVRLAVDAGTFDARVDRHLSRLALRLDEQGWRELAEIHDAALDASLEVQARAARRLEQSGEPAIEARSVHAFFELPKPKG